MAAMRTNWVTIYDRKNCQIDLTRQKGEVTMTEDTGHWKSEIGGAVSYEKFLEGSFHKLILEQFGEEVLAEVIASVEELVKG
jgi:predicted secreted protein